MSQDEIRDYLAELKACPANCHHKVIYVYKTDRRTNLAAG